MHKLIIASSTTPQNEFQQHCYQCIPQVICFEHVHIFDVGETYASSYQQLTVCGANQIHVQYLIMQTLFDTRKLYHVYNYIIIIHIWHLKSSKECSKEALALGADGGALPPSWAGGVHPSHTFFTIMHETCIWQYGLCVHYHTYMYYPSPQSTTNYTV